MFLKVASFCIEQVYVNTSSDSAEGMFVLHLDPCSVVFDFKLKCEDGVLDGQVIEIECKDNAALGAGSQLLRLRSQVGLLSEEPYCFRVNLGTLSKGRLDLQFSFVTRLALDANGSLVARIPRHLLQCSQQAIKGINQIETGVANLSSGNLDRANVVIGIVGRHIQAISCGSDGILQCKTFISQKSANVGIHIDQLRKLQQDLVVAVEMEQPLPILHASFEKNEDGLAVMVSIVPQMEPDVANTEFILLVDRGKAMTGMFTLMIEKCLLSYSVSLYLPVEAARLEIVYICSETVCRINHACTDQMNISAAQISCAKSTARVFLELLPPDSCFNVLALGSEMQVFLRYPQQCTESIVKEAIDFVDMLTIDNHVVADVLGAFKYVRDGQSNCSYQKVPFFKTTMMIISEYLQ